MRREIDETLTALCERLARLQSDTVGDVLDEMGLQQILSAAIQPLQRNMKVAGPAFCIKGREKMGSTVQASDNDTPKPGFEMFRHMYEGCVAVIDTGSYMQAGPWGENTGLSAMVRGCKGVVIDGGTRDAQELIEMEFPTFVRFVSAARVEGRWTQTSFEEPIVLPGQTSSEVTINPGDLILADVDGVVVVPQSLARQVIEDAEEITRIEEQMRTDLMQGVDREAVYRKYDRYAHIHPKAGDE